MLDVSYASLLAHEISLELPESSASDGTRMGSCVVFNDLESRLTSERFEIILRSLRQFFPTP